MHACPLIKDQTILIEAGSLRIVAHGSYLSPLRKRELQDFLPLFF